MIEKRPFRYFLNRNHGVPGIAVLPESGYARAKAEIMTWPGYAPTPLVALDTIAKAAGVVGLPHAAAGGAHEEHIGLLGNAGHRR
jgi:diaminopropionate ammonia-lyase